MNSSRWRPWAWPSELRQRGILGMNRRNASYLLPCNPRQHYPRVDDKLITKRICESQGIPVPKTYGIIERQSDVRRFPDLIANRSRFVIKPAGGSEGRGIVVIAKQDGHELITAGEERHSIADLRYHLSAIVAGLYSLGGRPDRAIIEQRIMPHPVFDDVAVGGTPDIRVVIYRNVPAMAMARLPTRASRGRANLHQGAVGVGVDLDRGVTFGGVCKSRATDRHPDTGRRIAGVQIPQWNELLDAATTLADHLELGYIGVDFVLDSRLGPVVLEANARPGLAIQIANRAGLLPRLKNIDALSATTRRADERIPLVAALQVTHAAHENMAQRSCDRSDQQLEHLPTAKP